MVTLLWKRYFVALWVNIMEHLTEVIKINSGHWEVSQMLNWSSSTTHCKSAPVMHQAHFRSGHHRIMVYSRHILYLFTFFTFPCKQQNCATHLFKQSQLFKPPFLTTTPDLCDQLHWHYDHRDLENRLFHWTSQPHSHVYIIIVKKLSFPGQPWNAQSGF